MKYRDNSFRQSFSISFRFIIVSSSSTKFTNLVASVKSDFEFFLVFVESVFVVSFLVSFHVHVETASSVFSLASLDVFVEFDLLASSIVFFFDSFNASHFHSTSSNFIYLNFQ
jgi:hypothetical protein